MHLIKGYGTIRLIKEFPIKNWKLGGVNTLLTKIRCTGCTDRQKGSGRPRSIRNVVNVNDVQDLVLSQEDQPQTHRSIRQISRDPDWYSSLVSISNYSSRSSIEVLQEASCSRVDSC